MPLFSTFSVENRLNIRKALKPTASKVKRKRKTLEDVKLNALKYGSMIVEIFDIYPGIVFFLINTCNFQNFALIRRNT